ncbi:RagB/SusD family nutrient uptake outer membrane protein [Aliifodinibius sp. S!AR15-10]|uniref:RagB/SusD family nutrient uptake outer membrane protein n=1 Tax=Aliifodinibius sp. S!AR15-10 TaxID=2950437 RepID=UPI00285918B4|nr:RagB/SusD family nutrient uptake outer membrane protein [Aliifodinibius sp. S!AR15-10]MDR8392551.1 RagB/SusD family nutrient uptake outer membrane protein [Aliifodinibius sp. S!AR15-10]
MKNTIFKITAMCVLTLGVLACDVNSLLDQKPLDQISEDAVWNDPPLVEAYVNEIYWEMYHGYQGTMLAGATDEAHFIHGYGTAEFLQANITPSNLGAFENDRYENFEWGSLYGAIREANVVLSKLPESTIEDQQFIDQMTGEAHFLRAFFYHQLLRFYGGVPLITEPYGLDDDMSAARNSFKETVDFIVAEADKAAGMLPLTRSDSELGRASAGAAMALKSRVLLYAASDLYHDNPSGNPETGYTSGQDRTQMWRDAKNAAQAVMDLNEYSLFRPSPANDEEATQNFIDLFLQQNSEEVIMQKYLLRKHQWMGNYPGLENGPNGYHNWAGNTPIQAFIDDFRMADGTEFDWNNPAHASDPYANRDPRFDATVLHDGSNWRQRPPDAVGLDPHNIIQSFREITLPDGTVLPGIDTRDGPIEDWNGSYTSYYLRKFIDPTVAHANGTTQEIPWIYFRYGEILLNYAEASIELGEEEDARNALNQLRERAHMPDITASGQALIDEYRNERRVEMAYEEQRYFDIRRWMIAPDVHTSIRGMDIYVEGQTRADRSSYTNYQYEVSPVIQERVWDDKLYFLPITLEEINRNDQLTQNPGY